MTLPLLYFAIIFKIPKYQNYMCIEVTIYLTITTSRTYVRTYNRRINDHDIERCKRHKNFSLGSFVFSVVLIAATIAMMSESLVDQMMDVTVSSLWLGFLVVNVKLCAISPLILVTIYCIVFGCIAYRAAIFFPSIKRAREGRLRKALAAKEFSTSKRNRTMSWSVRRSTSVLCVRMSEYVGHFLNLIINEAKETRREFQISVGANWCCMNRSTIKIPTIDVCDGPRTPIPESINPFFFQNSHYCSDLLLPITDHSAPFLPPLLREHSDPDPITVSIRASSYFPSSSKSRADSILSGTFRKPKQFKRSSVTGTHPAIPLLILQMRPSGTSNVEVVDGTDSKYAQHLNGVDKCNTVQGLDYGAFPIVSRHGGSMRGEKARVYTSTTAITTNKETALKRMLNRHILGVTASERGQTLDLYQESMGRHSYVLVSELKDLLHWCFTIYHPSGLPVSDESRAETIDNLVQWRTIKSRYDVGSYSVSNGLCKTVSSRSEQNIHGNRNGNGNGSSNSFVSYGFRESRHASLQRFLQLKTAASSFVGLSLSQEVRLHIPEGDLSQQSAWGGPHDVTSSDFEDGMTFIDFSVWFLEAVSWLDILHSCRTDAPGDGDAIQQAYTVWQNTSQKESFWVDEWLYRAER